MKQQDEFYKQMDDFKRSKNSCSCWGFLVLMLLLLFFAELTLFFVARGVRFDPSEQVTISRQTEEAQFSALEGEDGTVEVVVSEGVLCSKLSAIRPGSTFGCAISEEGIMITGKIATFLPSNASFLATPVAKDGKVRYDVKYLRVGNFKVASFLAPTIAGALSEAINSQLEDIEVTEVGLSDAIMVVGGKRAGNR